jgi:hypothetical protein
MNSKPKIRCSRIVGAKSLALAGALLLFALANSVEAEVTYSPSCGGVILASYPDASEAVTIPSTINCLPVVGIGTNAFESCSNLTSVTIPDSVISIGDSAFANCTNLTEVTIGSGVTIIGEFPIAGSGANGFTIANSITNVGAGVFGFSDLTNVTVPYGVTNIGGKAFYIYFAQAGAGSAENYTTIGSGAFTLDVRLTTLEIHSSVTSIGDGAFYFCTSLKEIRFMGNAPSFGHNVFASDNLTISHLPGTTGWEDTNTIEGLPTGEWTPESPVILTRGPKFGAQNNAFGFTIYGSKDASVVVQSCTNLSNPVWMPAATAILSNGTFYFSDPQWANNAVHFYRIAPP